jgi:hypothetical protein
MTESRLELINSIGEREFNMQETLQLLKFNTPIFWSWGVSLVKNYKNTVMALKVSAMHHKGYVYISLAYNDTYTVTIANNRDRVLKTYKEVYFYKLVETIDKHIERVEAYQK